MFRRRALTFVVAAIVSVAALGGGARPGTVSANGVGTVEYPGPACPDTGDTGLQQCISSLAAGSTIVLTQQIIGEVASFTKDFTLRASSRSLQPVLRTVFVASAGPAIHVTIQDIRIEEKVSVSVIGASGSTIRLRRVRLGTGPEGTGIEATIRAPATLSLEDSVVRSVAVTDAAVALKAFNPDGLVTFRLIGNRISGRGGTLNEDGIDIVASGSGSVRADVMGNVIHDIGTCECGSSAAIIIRADDTIRADVNVVGNTIERVSGPGLRVVNVLAPGGRLSLDVFDTIVSHAEGGAFSLDSGASGSLRFRAGSNAYYANAPSDLDGQSLGAGNVRKDPRYVDRGGRNLRLRADSPLIDKGLVCTPGGQVATDAAGRHRLAGRSVDIGAYERGARTASGRVRLGGSGRDTLRGTSGRDILCGYGGNDTLCARDGKGGDYLHGGSGRDRARSDAGDTRRSIEASAAC